ncbi:MAG TPA: hypothetical protein VF527_08390 [Pyrinomonadaceae bacterium]|jgi:hypothetical protein
MKLRQMFLVLILIPAIQMSASAQKALDEWSETGNLLTQARPFETAKANAPDPAPAERAGDSEMPKISLPAPVPTPLNIAFTNKMHADSYMDAYRILKEENTCSDFFGGAVNATEVLNRFTEQLRQKRFSDPYVAVEMSGAVILFHDRKTGASYRLFERVSVNSIGPLSVTPLVAQAQRRAIGRFPSDTKAARALILLHEIGHLVRGTNGRWLLPNDGHDNGLSTQNTDTVESYCLKQLNALKH